MTQPTELADALGMDVERLHELEAAPGTPIRSSFLLAKTRNRSLATCLADETEHLT